MEDGKFGAEVRELGSANRSCTRLSVTGYRLGFIGTRRGMTLAQQAMLRSYLKDRFGEFHHGDGLGADAQAHDIASDCGYAIVIHPAIDRRLRAFKDAPDHMVRREQQYMIRNKEIVLETIALIAAPAEEVEQRRSETWGTYRFARSTKRPTVLILPNGKLRQDSNRR